MIPYTSVKGSAADIGLAMFRRSEEQVLFGDTEWKRIRTGDRNDESGAGQNTGKKEQTDSL